MKISDIQNITLEQFNSMNEKELREVSNQLFSAANKRLRRAEAAGRSTPATEAVKKQLAQSGQTQFSSKDKTYNQLKQEFFRAKNFVENKTSTYSGWRQEVKDIRGRFEDQTGQSAKTMSDADIRKYYEAVDKFREVYGDKAFRYSEKAAAEIIKQGGSVDDALNNMFSTMKVNYEMLEAAYAEKEVQYSSEVSDFFDIWEEDNPFD